jgi:predicted ATPase
MAEDERATIAALDAARTVFRNRMEVNQGRVVDMAGDSVLAVFETATGAVTAALAIQRDLVALCEPIPEHQQMRFRIGIHLGDISEKADGSVYGDGVNISARLQALADAGGIVVSEAIHGAVRGKLSALFLDLGEQHLKHSPHPVRAFEVRAPDSVGTASGSRRLAIGPGGVGTQAMNASCVFGPFEIRPEQRQLVIDGQPAAIGARAFDVLMALFERRDRTVPKAELLDVVWPGLVVEENNLQAQVSAIRKVLGRKAIATIPGIGYRFTLAVASTDGAQMALRSDSLSPTAQRTNVLQPAQPLIGREAEVAAIEALLVTQRLVVVHGPGGIGKTRLAQAVAHRRIDTHADGVWWVDLSALSAADGIVPAIAAAARLQLADSRDPTTTLVRALAARDVLLVLDNCERFAAEIAAIMQRALNGSSRLTILATSQEALRCASEHLYPLAGLAVPSPACTLEDARRCAALQLLEQRAQAADGRFRLTERTGASATELCRRLDGNALAIEMAAARLPLLGAEGVNALLNDRLRLLRGAAREAPPRQQSLRATLDWTHSLLSGNAQIVFRRLAPFVGSFRLEAAQAIAADAQIDAWAVLDGLGDLADKSLLHVDRHEPPRYRLLETARLYAGDTLTVAGEAAEIATRHGVAMQQIAEEAEREYWIRPEDDWLDRYAADYDDLQRAFDGACASGTAGIAADTAEVLGRIDALHSINTFVRHRADAAHALLPGADPATRARLWDCVISHRLVVSAAVSRLEAARQRVAAWRPLGDAPRLYRALLRLAVEHAVAGNAAASAAALAEAKALEEPHWPARLRYEASSDAAMLLIYKRADALIRIANARLNLLLAERAGAPREAARARTHLADAVLMSGDVGGAIALGREAVAALRALGQPARLGVALGNLCGAFLIAGDVESATEAASHAWPLMIDNDEATGLLDHLAAIALSAGASTQAAQLLGASDAAFARDGAPRQPNEEHLTSRVVQGGEAALGATEFARLRGEGARLPIGEALALAQSVLDRQQVAKQSIGG